jgi:hypothetical protein
MQGASTADGLVDDELRQRILDRFVEDEHAREPSGDRWEQLTIDDAAEPRPTWGLQRHVLAALKADEDIAEVHTRLQKLYPDVAFMHMPVQHMQAGCCAQADSSPQLPAAASLNSTDAHAADGASCLQSPVELARSLRTPQAPRHKRQRSCEDDAEAECHCFVGNAAVHGDDYQWHVDADPMSVPADSRWFATFGQYANRVRLESVQPARSWHSPA